MRQAILALLKKHQGSYLSGEEISKILGISRTAVWKHMNKLREEGYDIDSITKMGYKLNRIPDTLLPEEISTYLKTKVLGRDIYYFQEIDSTNYYGKALGEKGVSEGALVLAETQQKGRGRLGRSWNSPPKKGLWFSILLRPQISPQEISLLTLLAATAIVQVLKRKYQLKAGIKWPNDLLLDGRKFAGILTEMKAETDQVNYLVLGIGINVNQGAEDFPEELVNIATSLSLEKGSPLHRAKLLAAILEELENMYFRFLQEGFNFTLELWKKYNITLGQHVVITNWQSTFKGYAEDIDSKGGLIVVLADGTRKTVYSGDVSSAGSKP